MGAVHYGICDHVLHDYGSSKFNLLCKLRKHACTKLRITRMRTPSEEQEESSGGTARLPPDILVNCNNNDTHWISHYLAQTYSA